jgi:hypothetical protein
MTKKKEKQKERKEKKKKIEKEKTSIYTHILIKKWSLGRFD